MASEKDMKIYLEDGSFVRVKAGKTDTTDVVVDLVFQKLTYRPDGVPSDFTLAERRDGSITRLLVEEEWPYSTLKSKGSGKEKPKIELVFVPKDADLPQLNETYAQARTLSGLSFDDASTVIDNIMTGWLTKRGAKVTNWKRRWCIVLESQMKYFEEEPREPGGLEGQKLKGTIELEGCYVTPCNSMQKPNCFLVSNTPDARDYYFYTDNVADMAAWMAAIRKSALRYVSMDTQELVESVETLQDELAEARAVLAMRTGSSRLMGEEQFGSVSLGDIQEYEQQICDLENRALQAETQLSDVQLNLSLTQAELADTKRQLALLKKTSSSSSLNNDLGGSADAGS